jgi:hypothetical protein
MNMQDISKVDTIMNIWKTFLKMNTVMNMKDISKINTVMNMQDIFKNGLTGKTIICKLDLNGRVIVV